MFRYASIVLVLGLGAGIRAQEPLLLERQIPLDSVMGRIDHLAADMPRRRLFVAELGNDSVDVIDLDAGKPTKRLSGLRQPQGLGFANDVLYVASAGDGVLHLFEGAELKPAADIALGSDADNVHVDASGARVYVGYGEGAIAIIDSARRIKVADIVLPVHPEGFQIDADGRHAYVNLPGVHGVAIADIAGMKVEKQVATKASGDNFPLAIDARHERLLVVFRNPSSLIAYAIDDGKKLQQVGTCNDADDIHIDAQRQRAYVSCGDGYLDVFTTRNELERIAHLRTASGARTSLFVPEIGRLFLTVRASGGKPAAIWVYRPIGD